MRVDVVEVRVVRVPLVRPFATSQGTTREREAIVARVVGEAEGWGESETRDGAIDMATLDASLRLDGVSLAAHLGGVRAAIDSTATVGFEDDVGEFVDLGYRSIKFKVAPGRPVPSIPSGITAQVDANGSYAACPGRVAELDELGLVAIEQPLAPDDLAGHAELKARLRTPICLDESVTSAGALDARACSAVCVKPWRVGGLVGARAVHDRCVELHLDAKVGGMLETGIGRSAALALASLPGFTLPADLSASDRYFAEDLTEPLVLDGDGRLAVPAGPGLGVEVRRDVVDRYTISVEREDVR